MPGEEHALTLDLGERLEPPLARRRARLGDDCPSDLMFANLYLFRAAHDYRLASAGAAPRLRGNTYDGTPFFLPLCGLGELSSAALAELIDQEGCLFPVSGAELALLDADRFAWSAHRGDSDYLYRRDNFVHYRGVRLRKRRNLLKQLLRQHRPRCVALADAPAEHALAVLDGWMRDKEQPENGADYGPCREALLHGERLGLHGYLWYLGEAPAGFLLAQPLSDGVDVIRFAKGRDRHKGIYPYMFHHYCADLRPHLGWLNFEQDMGLANFRQSKLSYDPQVILPKYRVWRKA